MSEPPAEHDGCADRLRGLRHVPEVDERRDGHDHLVRTCIPEDLGRRRRELRRTLEVPEDRVRVTDDPHAPLRSRCASSLSRSKSSQSRLGKIGERTLEFAGLTGDGLHHTQVSTWAQAETSELFGRNAAVVGHD